MTLDRIHPSHDFPSLGSRCTVCTCTQTGLAALIACVLEAEGEAHEPVADTADVDWFSLNKSLS